MKIVPFDDQNWAQDHPTGNIAFQHMLKGDPSSRENFMYILGRQDADFYQGRHRHNFDQIRLPLRGTMNHGDGIVLGEGEVAYIPEGLAYGPQDDPVAPYAPGQRLQLVLQFGGASGYGFMSIDQRRQARKELSAIDPASRPGLNAIWKHVFGVPLKYARPRYGSIVIADPKRFNWLRMGGAPGVEQKFLGAFSERGVWVEMVRVHAGASWSSSVARARRLLVVLSGEGHAGISAIARLTAIDIDPGETLELHATSAMELFLIGLPLVELAAEETDQYDPEELPLERAPA
jgi:hypothetical protein